MSTEKSVLFFIQNMKKGDSRLRKKKWIIFVVCLLISVCLGIGSEEPYQAATSYTNAKEFYESTALDGEPYHSESWNGAVYYATYAKLASSSTNLKYATVGFDITLTANGHSVSFAIERYGNSITMVDQKNSGGYQYDLYAVEDKELYRLAQAVDPANAAYVLDSSLIRVQIDAIMVTKQGGTPNGGITENGYGGISKWGTIYRLKNSSDLNALKSIFYGHDFESYKEIKSTLDNPKLQIRYAANGTDAANTNASSAVSVGNGFKVVNYTENGVKIPYVLYVNGGLYTSSSRVLQAMTLLKPSAAAMDKAGYHLIPDKEWITEGGKVLSANKSYMPREIAPEVGLKDTNIYVYANWKPNTYTISYDANGGTGTMADTNATYDKAVSLRNNTFSRTGYTFKGWSFTKNGSRDFANGETVSNLTSTNGGVVKLYAVWEPEVYKITLDSQGAEYKGTTAFYEKYENGNYTTSLCLAPISRIEKPIRQGYTFGGYFMSRAGNGKQCVSADGSITSENTDFTKDTPLYAKWDANPYIIRYNANGGTGTMADTLATYDIDISLRTNMFFRTGYNFKGWAASSNGTVDYIDKAVVKNLTSTNGGIIHLYAVWEPVTPMITLNPQEGSGGTESFYEKYSVGFYSNNLFSTLIAKISIPDRTGYNFQGYFADKTSSGSPLIDAAGNILAKNTTFVQDTTLFARWLEKTFTITFDKQGGSYGTDSVTATYNHLVPEAQVPVRAGFTFKGYYTGKEGTGTLYYDAFMNPQVIYQNLTGITLYAYWVDTTVPEITLNVSNDTWTNQPVILEAIARDSGSGLSSVEIFRIADNGTLTSVAKATGLNGAASKTLTFVNTIEGVIRYKAVATDMEGNVSESYNTVYYDITNPNGEVIQFTINGTTIYIDVNVTDINPGN